MKDTFDTETELFIAVRETNLLRQLHCRYGWQIWEDTEVEGLFGRPDYLVGYYRVDEMGRSQIRTVAFEMKLANWKRALTQAFRYAAFSHYAYVVMDHCHIGNAVNFLDQFIRANIGLLSFSKSGELQVYHRPPCRKPYAADLQAKLHRKIVDALQQDEQMALGKMSVLPALSC